MSDTGVRLYNTLTKQKDPLETGPDGVVRIYVCGPTVYGRVHIGNARPFVVFSILKRFLTRRRGLAVRFVSNLTDVNDKIYDAARAEGVASDELAERYGRAYVEDTDRLGVGRPDAEPKVTETIPAIEGLIGDLVESGLAYPADGDVYFRVERFPGYGSLSGRRLDEMVSTEPGSGKEHPLDFALWKGRKPEEDTWWESPWGPGRPGWHIECSAMAESLLGDEFEVHGGGIDLVFPHHENEIAQTEGARHRPLARIWMHNEMLELAGDKMSKSVGNIAPLAEVLDRWPRETVIAYFLTSHYRSKLPFSDDRLEEAGRRNERIRNALRQLERGTETAGDGYDSELAGAAVGARLAFDEALADDFNTPEAFAGLDGLVRAANAALERGEAGAAQLRETRRALLDLLDVFTLATLDEPSAEVPPNVRRLVEEREEARRQRDFARADALREEVGALGWEVRDSPEGPEILPR